VPVARPVVVRAVIWVVQDRSASLRHMTRWRASGDAAGAEEWDKDEAVCSSPPVFASLTDVLVRLARAIEAQELRLGGDESRYHFHREQLRRRSPDPVEDIDREAVRYLEAKYPILRELYPPDGDKDEEALHR
jgi:hypothetical protein